MVVSEYPTFSVIVPSYNVERAIEKCIQALLDQNYPKEKFSIIIVDDKSTDKTLSIVKGYSDNKQVKIVKHFQNRGLSATRNSGIKASNSELIAFLDGDLVVQKDWAKLLAGILDSTDVVACMGDTKLPNEFIPNNIDRYLYSSKRGVRSLCNDQSVEVPGFIMGNSAVKREALNECGLFDEEFDTWGGEDTDLAIRLWGRYPNGLRFEAKAVALHYHQRKLEVVLNNMFKYGQTNYLLLLKKHPKYANRLAADWIHSTKGYLILNPVINFFVLNIFRLFQYNRLVRYLIAYNVMQGARNPAEGYPKLKNKND